MIDEMDKEVAEERKALGAGFLCHVKGFMEHWHRGMANIV